MEAMQTNFLEELVAEWYEYQGYLVKRNEHVGPNPKGKGGFEGELDIVAFDPRNSHLIHVETSTDCWSWPVREQKFRKKFACGAKHARTLFEGLRLPDQMDQLALFIYGSDKDHGTIGPGRVQMVDDLMTKIVERLKDVPFSRKAVPERYPLLRLLQMVAHWRNHPPGN
jgi:hypothetical protein